MATEPKMLLSPNDEIAAQNLRDAGATLVSCAGDPFDLRPAVESIVEHIEAARGRLRDGQKLIVLMGETHAIPSHRMLQAQLIACLHEREIVGEGPSLAAGMELPYNFMTMKLADMSLLPLSSTVQHYLERRMGSAGLISAFLDDNFMVAAPQSKSFLMNTIGARGISLRFHDVAFCYERCGGEEHALCLDRQDKAIRALIASEQGSSSRAVNVEEPLGMSLRNKFMAENIRSHIKATDADVYIHMVGLAHLMGVRSTRFSFKDSLYARLMADDYEVLNVLPVESGNDGIHDCWQYLIPEQAREMGLRNTVIVTDMVQECLDDRCIDKELEVIGQILTQSDARDIQQPALHKDWQRQLASFKTDLPRWIAEAKNACNKAPAPRV